MTRRPVRDPELPESARPQWPPWYAPAALFASIKLVYERTGSLVAAIAIHAGFNTFAMLSVVPLPAILIGLLVIAGCLVAPLKAGRWPSPVPA